jgi:sialic acid synthase SpsE/spore coat polysaccharide biosynthesis protein SpsF (cytidylyltransferase family)
MMKNLLITKDTPGELMRREYNNDGKSFERLRHVVPRIICVIPAKSGSRRLKNKNMREIGGKPLIYYAIQTAKRSKILDNIYVSTDSEEIGTYARKMGVEVIKRGPELCGETPLLKVFHHAYQSVYSEDISYIVGLQPDNPDRSINIDEAIHYGLDSDLDLVHSVNSEGKVNGSFWMIKASFLKEKRFDFKVRTVMDPCTNIHTEEDLLTAHRHLFKKNAVQVANKKMGKGCPTFIIAEGACNHMCDLELAKEMIIKAKEAGADAIKFQAYKAECLVTKDAESYWKYPGAKSQFEYYKNLDKFGAEEYSTLFDYAAKEGIIAFATPFDTESASMLNALGVPLFKIASCDLPDVRLLRHIAGFKKPIILSTGGSAIEEIKKAVNTLTKAGVEDLILMVCTLSYPAENESAHLNRILTFKREFPDLIIGLSDHTKPEPNMVIPSVAVALGASVIEKHYTLDRNMTGSGHAFSVTPDDLKKMIENIRITEQVLGSSEIVVYQEEEAARINARRSLVAEIDIKKGEVITSDMIGIKRPGNGILGFYIDEVIGRVAKEDIKKDEQISFDQLE